RAGGRPTQGTPGCIAGRNGRRHPLRRGYRFLGRRALQPAAAGEYDHLSLPGALGGRRAAFPIVRRGSQGCSGGTDGGARSQCKKQKEKTAALPSGSAKRHFEFSEGGSNKFWEIAVSGSEVTVRFGRIGTNGQTQTKKLPEPAAATKHADKLIAEKVDKGYVEAGG